eukprot:CAMPEP_0201566398 /NCGR_PEP_ID=MMETSP0190_2-20130828/6148_1 /ASSEMBLY_ACC=CAM_ASM_000263 /TAXON_ID=37353 /ORGANISM="Rosalina sp." /LENGTH=141 /DNA_ID=CAMNT_0047985049 /DNA_START=140 /DNA_END=562 /DNA_ORIENTATION=+
MARAVLPATATIMRHQQHRFTVYTGYGKTTPDLEEIHDKWMNTYNKRDVNELVSMYTEDCTIMPCGDESISGHEHAKKFFSDNINKISEIVAHLDEAGPMDKDSKMAYIRGTYTYLNIGDLDNVVDDGKNVMILKKVKDEW